jgi:hypothetical protein
VTGKQHRHPAKNPSSHRFPPLCSAYVPADPRQEVKRLFPQAILQRLRILQLLLGVNQGKHAVVLLQIPNLVEHSVLQHLDKQAARSRMIMIRAWGQRNHCGRYCKDSAFCSCYSASIRVNTPLYCCRWLTQSRRYYLTRHKRMRPDGFPQPDPNLVEHSVLQHLDKQLLLGVNQGKHAVVLLQMANSEPQVGLISEPPDDTSPVEKDV